MENYSIIYNEIKSLCDFNDITLAKLERSLGFSERLISKWKASNPSINKLIPIADYFNVSLYFISGRTLIHQMSEKILVDDDLISIRIAINHMSIDEICKMMAILRLTFPEAFNYSA